MTIQTVRSGLAARVATISGLEAYQTIPTTPQAPCVLVRLTGADYDQTMADGGIVVRFDLVLLASQVGTAWDVAQDALDQYLDGTGALSIKAAVEADVTLGGTAYTSRVTGWTDYGTIIISGTEYMGARFSVETWPV